jgi:hypothetical protein
MAHWAEIDENNIVVRVIVGDNDDPNNDEGYKWIADNLGGIWVKTSYNGTIRKNFAGIGYTYNSDLDAFIEPKPFPSWILNEEAAKWQAPVQYPENGFNYNWNEESLAWDIIDSSKDES